MVPLQASDRRIAMDVVRGFALGGIVLMNIEGMAGPPNSAMTGLDPALAGADRWADALVYLLVQGKFHPLFSMLFGMGFAVMLARAEGMGRAFTPVYLRRIAGLLAIGLVHLLLVWSGDILTSYALVGLALLAFRGTQPSRLPTWGISLYLVPAMLLLVVGLAGSIAQPDPASAAGFNREIAENARAFAAETERQRLVYGSGAYVDAVALRSGDLREMLMLLPIMGWQILGLFVLGLWFERSGAIARPQGFKRLHAGLRWLALPLGLLLVVASFVLMPTADFSRFDAVSGIAHALAQAGSLLVALGYLGWIVRGLQSAAWARRLGALAPAGRMALSNYLAQSLVGTLVFHGHGLGWFGQVPRAWQLPFCLALFGVQVLASRWWLDRFRHGPVEWAWRALTYWRLPPMRVVAMPAK